MNEDKMVLSEYARLRTINSLASHLSCSFLTKVLKLIYKCEDFVQEKHKDKPTANRLIFFSFITIPYVWVSDNLFNYRMI